MEETSPDLGLFADMYVLVLVISYTLWEGDLSGRADHEVGWLPCREYGLCNNILFVPKNSFVGVYCAVCGEETSDACHALVGVKGIKGWEVPSLCKVGVSQ